MLRLPTAAALLLLLLAVAAPPAARAARQLKQQQQQPHCPPGYEIDWQFVAPGNIATVVKCVVPCRAGYGRPFHTVQCVLSDCPA